MVGILTNLKEKQKVEIARAPIKETVSFISERTNNSAFSESGDGLARSIVESATAGEERFSSGGHELDVPAGDVLGGLHYLVKVTG
ncbi:hypothetical protein EVAR_78990_1 [Eumeta japonica]|uniref:Uncharacterized protein n=1 Tax=Eumeta variegata TaxID=151549 RepID=A0A4C1UU00_EUMVA|nr:hypothetical protein EVAR_78990_1 [Eumeta japonica]